jgi:organic hydroperoxide reductase OsmC/OhrA
MSQHSTIIAWNHFPHQEEANTYSRDHLLRLGGNQDVKMSAATSFKGSLNCADPEQLFISAIASCHMLTFLAVAELQGYKVASYEDEPIGQLDKTSAGAMAITKVTLSPIIKFFGNRIPTEEVVNKIHASAKKNCFIGNSVNTEIVLDVAYEIGRS